MAKIKPHFTTPGAVVVLCTLLGCGPQGGVELRGEPGQRQAAITNGTVDPGHRSVGMMLAKGSTTCSDPSLHGAVCTVTLVGQRTLLTAAHCVYPGETHIVCYDTVTTYKPQKLVVHSGWDTQTLANDIAMVILDKGPPVPPSPINRKPPSVGQTITLVGFGSTAETATDAGTKRVTTNTIKSLWATRFSYDGSGGSEGNTCHGDSGGPAFIVDNGVELQAGVTSAGVTPCGTLGYSTRVDAYLSWIEQTSGGDLVGSDTVKPQINIVSPVDGASLAQSQLTVQVSATDDTAVTEVELLADGVSSGKLTAVPYTFQLTLAKGSHTLKAVARDAAGNQGEDQISVTVTDGTVGPPPLPTGPSGVFGATCDSNDACDSGLCGTYNAVSYCTQVCDPAGAACPYGAECLPAGSQNVCGPPAITHGLDNTESLVGGCRVARGAGDGWLVGVLLLLGLGVVLRR